MGAVRRATFDELDPATLYALLRLRTDVFVVEQRCAYPELDGRDAEPSTQHLWTQDEHGPTACLRLLADDGVRRIGRVCTRVDARRRGLAADLVRAAVDLAGGEEVVLDAQSHLRAWYEGHGFTVTGPPFVEDGIPHVPMRRTGRTVRA